VAEETTDEAAYSGRCVCGLESGSDRSVLVSADERGHNIIKADVLLRDQLATEWIIGAHAAQRSEKE